MNRAIWRIIPFLAIFALIGCSSYDDLGGKARTFEPARSFVSLSPSTTELIHAAGVPPQAIIGRTSSCNYPKLACPVVVQGTEPNFEQIVALNPDKVIAEKDLYSQATFDKLKELGLDVIVVESNSIASYEEAIIAASKISGTEVTAGKYIDKLHAGISAYEGSVKPGIKIAVIIGSPTEGYSSLGKKSLLAELLTEGASEFLGHEEGKFMPTNIEQIVSWNPDVIITAKYQIEALLSDPAMQAVPAVAKKRVLGVNADVLMRNGGRVDTLLEALTIGVGRIVDIKGSN